MHIMCVCVCLFVCVCVWKCELANFGFPFAPFVLDTGYGVNLHVSGIVLRSKCERPSKLVYYA